MNFFRGGEKEEEDERNLELLFKGFLGFWSAWQVEEEKRGDETEAMRDRERERVE